MRVIDKNIVEQTIPLLEIRVLVYDLLRRTFLTEPSIDYIKLINSQDVIGSFPFADENVSIREGVDQVLGYLAKNDVQKAEVQDRLRWDYTRMFVGPYNLDAPPWESAYVSKERLIFQEETLRVRKKYLKYNLLPSNYGHEADDHLGLELDFMYRLSNLALERVMESDMDGNSYYEILSDQKIFLEEHLLRWVPDFAQDMADSAETEFYMGMAKVLRGFLEIDLKALIELLDT